jgi:hypothetical protein
LAQSQGSALNDSNFFSAQEGANGSVFVDNTGDTQNAGSYSALNGSFFSVAAIADSMSEATGVLTTAASLVEATVQSAAEFAHSFGVVGLAFGTGADFISLQNNGISQTQFNVNLGVGAAGLAGGVLTTLPSAQYFIATWSYNHFYPGGSQQAWQDLGNLLNNMSSNGLGP